MLNLILYWSIIFFISKLSILNIVLYGSIIPSIVVVIIIFLWKYKKKITTLIQKITLLLKKSTSLIIKAFILANVTSGIIFYCYFTNSVLYHNVLNWLGLYFWMVNLFIFWFVYNVIFILRNWSKISHLWSSSVLNKLFMILSIIMLLYVILEHIYIVSKVEFNFINYLRETLLNKWFWYGLNFAIILFINFVVYWIHTSKKWKLNIGIYFLISNIILFIWILAISNQIVHSQYTSVLNSIKCDHNILMTHFPNFEFWSSNTYQHYINKLSFYNYLDWTKIPIVLIWLKFVTMTWKISDINLDKNEKLKKIFNDDEVKIFNDKIFYSVVSPKASGKTHLVSKYKKEIKQISVSELFQETSGTKSLSELLELKIRDQSLIDNFVLKLFSIEGVIKSGDNFKYLENEIIIIEDLEKLINDYDVIENSVKYHRCEEFFAYLKRIEDYFINNDNKPIIILCSAKDIWSHIKE